MSDIKEHYINNIKHFYLSYFRNHVIASTGKTFIYDIRCDRYKDVSNKFVQFNISYFIYSEALKYEVLTSWTLVSCPNLGVI